MAKFRLVPLDDIGKEKKEPGPGSDAEFTESLFSGAAEKLTNNILQIPNVVSKGLMRDFEPPHILSPGGEMSQMDGWRVPENPLNIPSGRQALSGLEAGVGLLTGNPNVTGTYDAAMQMREGIEQANPGAHSGGEFMGDVLTLFGGRAPAGGRMTQLVDEGMEGLANAIQRVTRTTTPAASGTAKTLESIGSSTAMREMLRATGRAAETGVEGAALSILENKDPLEGAAYAAGAQLAASGALKFGSGVVVGLPERLLAGTNLGKLEKGLLGVAGQAVLLSTLFNVLQQNPDQAQETAYDKVALGMAIGLLGVAGKRPKPDGALSNFPALADAILTVPRAGMIKASQTFADDWFVGETVKSMAENPDQFSEDQIKEFQKGIENGNLDEVARKLYSEREFQPTEGSKGFRLVPVK